MNKTFVLVFEYIVKRRYTFPRNSMLIGAHGGGGRGGGLNVHAYPRPYVGYDYVGYEVFNIK